MSEKKDPGTALVPTRVELIDERIVPRVGYDNLLVIEKEIADAKRTLAGTAKFTMAAAGVAVVGAFAVASLSLASPLYVIAATVTMFGAVGTGGGIVNAGLQFLRLTRTKRMRALPSQTDEDAAVTEGVARLLIESWNVSATRWNEGWDLLCREEASLFALQERCTSRKSLRNLVKRIEYVRKEKRKHLKVLAKLAVERDRIMNAIQSIQRRLPPTKEPLYLTDGNDDPP